MTANPNPHDRAELDALKASVDLVALFAAHGVVAKKSGQGFKACCPFHEDKTPSVSVDRRKGLWKCFGCGVGGDGLRFLELRKNLSFKEALQELRKFGGTVPAQPVSPQSDEPDEPFPYDLMARLADIWQATFCERPGALGYLTSRGLNDLEMLRLFQVGFCDGEQLSRITTAPERELLRRVGVISEGGKEFFARCVVFPLKDRQGRVAGFYGRSILMRSKLPHRFCAGTRAGLFYPQAACGARRVFLVEGVLDALAVYQAGFANVMATGGTQGFSPALLEFLRANKVAELVLCLDGDEAGQAASHQLEAKLTAEGFSVLRVPFPPGQDPLSLPAPELKERLSLALVRQPSSEPVEPSDSSPEAQESEPLAAHSDVPDEAASSQKSYKKLSSAQGKLKVLVSISAEGQRAEATVDLYSTRSRKQESISLARRLGLDVQEVENWLFSVLNELEEQKGTGENLQELFRKIEVPPMTPRQRAVALDFLRDPDLIKTILADMETLGYMGEEEAKLLGYCVSVSRKLAKPMSAIIQSGSGAGKSYLAEIINSLTPPEDVVFYSRLSQQALYHMPKDYLVHKLVGLEERAGGEGCDYQIRALQTSHRLVQAIVVKDPSTGQLFTKENEVLGPIAYIETTTNLRLNPENTSRCFEIPLDESPEQTRRIHQRQKALKSLERLSTVDTKESILQRHHNAQRLLEPVPVVIPYVHLLTFPDLWLRSRRDHDRYLHLIEVLAYLHQYQRPRKLHQGVEYIEATAQDYRWAYFLAHRVLHSSMDELSRWGRELLTFFEANPLSFTRREVREQLKWPDHRTRIALEELVDLEYLEVLRGAHNLLTFRLSSIKAVTQQTFGLLHPDELEARLSV